MLEEFPRNKIIIQLMIPTKAVPLERDVHMLRKSLTTIEIVIQLIHLRHIMHMWYRFQKRTVILQT